MAESIRTVSPVVPLRGSNYPTWKLQCRMVLMKAGLWSIVNGTEKAPEAEADAEVTAKYTARRDSALAHIVLSVDPTLLYLLGDPEDPVAAWKKLSDQFQRKSWANKLQLRRRLYSLRLRDGESVQEHIRKLTELFEELAVIGDPMKEEDQVVHLLASLPESFSVLVTALESSADVPKMEVVTERLIHEERKQQDKGRSSPGKALYVSRQKKRPRCFHCGKPGHFRRDCRQLKAKNEKSRLHKGSKSGKNQTRLLDRTPVRVTYSSSNKYYKLVLQKTGLLILVLPAICATTISCSLNSNCSRNRQKFRSEMDAHSKELDTEQ